MTRQKGANVLHYYAKCIFDAIFTFRSRFSRNAPKTLIFDALLRVEAGFLMMRQKGANLLHYFVGKQVFS